MTAAADRVGMDIAAFDRPTTMERLFEGRAKYLVGAVCVAICTIILSPCPMVWQRRLPWLNADRIALAMSFGSTSP